MAELITKCAIVGGGPAGYTAAIYSSRANLSPILIEGMQPGGQLTTTTDVENFPGFPEGINGTEMVMKMREQAIRFGANVRLGSSYRHRSQHASLPSFARQWRQHTGLHPDYRHGSQCTLPRAAWRRAVHGDGSLGLCHLRRLFLSQTRSCSGGRWRHCLRGGRISRIACTQGISHSPQTCAARIESNAAACIRY